MSGSGDASEQLGTGGVTVGGGGTVQLDADNTYTGDTTLSGSGTTLELGKPFGAGFGTIDFAPGSADTLQVDGTTMPDNPISGMTFGDIIDLRGLPFQTGATAHLTGTTLTVTSGGTSEQLTLINPVSADFTIPVTDGQGGTEFGVSSGPMESGFVGTATEAVQSGAAVTLLASLPTITDTASTTLADATVQISDYQSGDLLDVTTLGNITVQSNSNGTLVLTGTGTIADYEQVLASVTYRDTGNDTITVGHPTRTINWTVSDGALSSSAVTTLVTIDRPSSAQDKSASVSEGGTVTGTSGTSGTGALAGDNDLDGDVLTVSAVDGSSGAVGRGLAGTYGDLVLNADGSYSYTANNTAAINAAPAGTDPTDDFTYTVSDGNGGAATELLAIAITRPPAISGTVADQQTNAEAPVNPFSGVAITDPNAGATDTLTITLASTDARLGTLTGSGLTALGATYQLTGTAAAITAELDALSYTPVNGVPGTSVTTTFALSDQSSSFPTPATNDTTSVIDTDPMIMFPHAAPSSVDEWILTNGEWAASAEPGSIPSGYQVAGVGDFTSSGTSDILWQNPTTGDTQEWLIKNGGWNGTVELGTHPSNYQIAGVGDFFGNGIDDVLWTGVNSNGTVATDIWELGPNGGWITSVSPGSHPAGYNVVGVGDFTGNGTSDILWQNPTSGDVDEWQIADGQWSKSVDLGSHPGSGWTIAGVGDFFGNGTDDILWTNSTGGQVQTDIWQLGPNGQWQDSVSPGSHPAGYSVVGVGNFTGNGTSDILWQDAATGDVDEWLINNGKWAGSIDLGGHPGNFQVAGAGAFVNGNATSDILWQSHA